MKNKQSKNIIIAVLCCLILLMGIGFAILSTQLVINGNANVTGEWDIYIESITPIEEGYTGLSKSAFVDQNDKTKANFAAELKKPRDFVEYKVVVKNGGNIDAQLKQVLLEETNSHQDIKFSHTAVEDQVLYAGTTTEFTLKVEFLESATTIEKISVSSSIKLSYEQYDPSDISGDEGMGVPSPAEAVLKAIGGESQYCNVSKDGDYKLPNSDNFFVQVAYSQATYRIKRTNTNLDVCYFEEEGTDVSRKYSKYGSGTTVEEVSLNFVKWVSEKSNISFPSEIDSYDSLLNWAKENGRYYTNCTDVNEGDLVLNQEVNDSQTTLGILYKIENGFGRIGPVPMMGTYGASIYDIWME